MNVHTLKLKSENFKAIKSGAKTFDIREDSENFEIGDILVLHEYKNDVEFTGREIFQRITYISEFAQKENFVVLSIQKVPGSFRHFIEMTEKEKKVFREVISHLQMYSHSERDLNNTLWDIIRILLLNDEIDDNDRRWFMNFWHVEDELKKNDLKN